MTEQCDLDRSDTGPYQLERLGDPQWWTALSDQYPGNGTLTDEMVPYSTQPNFVLQVLVSHHLPAASVQPSVGNKRLVFAFSK